MKILKELSKAYKNLVFPTTKTQAKLLGIAAQIAGKEGENNLLCIPLEEYCREEESILKKFNTLNFAKYIVVEVIKTTKNHILDFFPTTEEEKVIMTLERYTKLREDLID